MVHRRGVQSLRLSTRERLGQVANGPHAHQLTQVLDLYEPPGGNLAKLPTITPIDCGHLQVRDAHPRYASGTQGRSVGLPRAHVARRCGVSVTDAILEANFCSFVLAILTPQNADHIMRHLR